VTQYKFTTEVNKLFVGLADCYEQVVNQNTNVAAEDCKVAQKRTSGLTKKNTHKLKLVETNATMKLDPLCNNE